jgi:GT2 family glycosyltransferase
MTKTIVVAVLTCERNETLEKFLIEYSKLAVPSEVRAILLVVDNSKDAASRKMVDSYRNRIVGLRYVVETTLGIPIARNRAVDEALAMQADHLCFIDDDEYPDQQWLTKIFSEWQHSKANLIGGPVQVADCCRTFGPWNRLINASLKVRQRRKNRAADRSSKNGRQPTIVTNNWMCDLHWLRRTGVRFDNELLYTGGSDTAFFRAAVAEGCKTAWCPDAVVHETMMRHRLGLRYQFRRGRSQSITRFHMKHPSVTPLQAVLSTIIAIFRFILGSLLFVVPVFGTASLVMAARSQGWAVGRIQAMLGRRSKLYVPKPKTQHEPAESSIDQLLHHPGSMGVATSGPVLVATMEKRPSCRFPAASYAPAFYKTAACSSNSFVASLSRSVGQLKKQVQSEDPTPLTESDSL